MKFWNAMNLTQFGSLQLGLQSSDVPLNFLLGEFLDSFSNLLLILILFLLFLKSSKDKTKQKMKRALAKAGTV